MVDFNATFRRIGRVGAMIGAINAYRGLVARGQVDGLVNIFSDRSVIDGIYPELDRYRSSQDGYVSSLSKHASDSLIADVAASDPVSAKNLATALTSLINDMQAAGATVAASTPSATVTPLASNFGNPAWVVDLKTPVGRACENVIPETISASCTLDGQPSGGGTAGSETISLSGQYAASGRLAWDYPRGSGSGASIRLVNAALNNQGGTGQWLTNGDFEAFPGNAPASWTVAVGSPGTTIKASTIDYFGADALSFVGNGVELTAITQQLGAAGVPQPVPLDRLAVNLFARVDSIPATGILEIALVDGNNAIIADASGTPNVITKSLIGLGLWGFGLWGAGTWGLPDGGGSWGTSAWGTFSWGGGVGPPYVPVGGVFRLPAVIPPVIRLRVRLSQPLPAGSTLNIDRVALCRMTSLYQQGPSVAAFAGNANCVKGDSWTIAVQNNLAGQIQWLFDRLYDMKGQGLLLPSSSRPTIPETMISLS